MAFLSKVFKSKDSSRTNTKHKVQQVDTSNGHIMPQAKPRFVSTWNSKEIEPEEVEELIRVCTLIMKSRAEALDTPFLLLPFRPETDTVPAKTFINNFFKANRAGSRDYTGSSLRRELVLTDPAVICSILKWCWSRMPGGVVTWQVYEGFRLGERDSNMARNAFDTFVPLGVDCAARKSIIFDFFDLLAAVAAHGKTNGHGGRKLSRMAGWWAFEHSDDGKGFEGGYKSWFTAADASSHLFFGYLRSLEPEALDGFTGINGLPRYLQALLAQTEYPPETPVLMQKSAPRVVMLVDSVSPGPFALLRRAKNFEYRDEDLQMFSDYADPVQALTEECRRVLNCIASANQSAAVRSQSAMGLGLDSLSNKPDESWSRFQDLGFSSIGDHANDTTTSGASSPSMEQPRLSGLRSAPRSRAANAGRPTTPSWADFLNSGFVDEADVQPAHAQLLLPSDKILPPIGDAPPMSSGNEEDLNPGELASITKFDLDDSFWWVWITSLANEEPSGRKAVFGRCALIETGILGGRWILLEEQVKGASPEPEEFAYIAEKKSRFGFSRRGKANRRKSAALPQKSLDAPQPDPRAASTTPNKASISPDQQARIRAAAATLNKQNRKGDEGAGGQRRGRHDDTSSMKTSSVLTLGLTSEAAPAMKWAHAFDKETVRKQYLGDNFAGKGFGREIHVPDNASTYAQNQEKPLPSPGTHVKASMERELPPAPVEGDNAAPAEPPSAPQTNVPAAVAKPANQGSPVAAALPSLSASINSERPIVQNATEVPAMPSVPKVMHVERKPVPGRTNNIQNHPALRPQSSKNNQKQSGTETPAERAAREAWAAKAANFQPDVLAHETKKTRPGLKKMFSSSKKKDDPKRNSFNQSPSMASLAPPSESSIGRKLSLLRKKSHTPTPPAQPAVPAAEPQAPAASPSEVSPLEPTFVPQQSPGINDHIVSPVQSYDANHAEDEFSRFDQGPLGDAPAWTPRESVDSHLQAEEAHKAELEAGRLDAPGGFPETPAETPMETQHASYEPEEVHVPVESAQEAAATYDRWAQIRKNAAERAARLSEEQSSRRPSHFTTGTEDEGETSGEETIEQRVARIKARVAHLTGTMDAPARKQI